MATLEPILEMIGGWIPEKGLDRALYGMYEGNSCNYQLFEKIEVLDCERRFQCPYKEMLEITSSLGTMNLTWEDVHTSGASRSGRALPPKSASRSKSRRGKPAASS